MEEVESFILHQPEDQQAVLQFLHELILSQGTLFCKIRYKIPFYGQHRWICYLNPLKNKGGIELAFIKGSHLADPHQLLASRNRQQIKGVIFQKIAFIPVQKVAGLIQEAIWIDEQANH